MSADLAAPPAATAPPADETMTRADWVALARIPAIALGWLAAAFAACALIDAAGWRVTINTTPVNVGVLAVICLGMVVAAVIDGYAFKVPNWCTLSLVVSGWYVGLAHDLGIGGLPGLSPEYTGGFLAAFACTVIGFLFLFPALFIGGMGEGDVKMTMGFGSWMGAYFGLTGYAGPIVLWWSFAVGAIIGGVFGLVIMILRREPHKNLLAFQEIGTDLKVLVNEGPEKAAARANTRRKDWWRLPYGVPLCAGFLGYLWYTMFVAV